MPNSDLRLDILGTSFSITADEDAAYLEEILEQYRAAVKKTQDLSNLKDPLKIAILTGFLLSDEIRKLRDRKDPEWGEDAEAQEAEKLTLNLIARIDEALDHKPPSDD
ncbi:MAG: cell division protein ZapA [Treponema sp.]|jgi:cell division protein ZapA (FtsZ GTPase activity inhibitor)|nr:cell division protein ZapA [Treponema sp.]